MQFAIVNGTSLEPAPRLSGVCKSCGSEMVAKCGQHKLWHWAHKSRAHCDPWWEAETKWHREWKNHFPKEWHETVLSDAVTGEKHIADVKTDSGLVLEFQHSAITPAEMRSREAFYINMVWVVDGCRGELDAAHFNLSLGGRINESPAAHSLHWHGRSKLFHNWIQATKPVLIDFGGPNLWRLVVFDPSTKKGAVGPGGKEYFIRDFIQGNPLGRIIR
jgi:competence protein CoiA